MDEVDSIGSARTDSSGGGGGGDSEVQRTMLELLNQLDGFEATNKIKVLLACLPAAAADGGRCCCVCPPAPCHQYPLPCPPCPHPAVLPPPSCDPSHPTPTPTLPQHRC